METARLNGIAQVALTVENIEKAVAFYRDLLGLKFLFQAESMAFFDGGNLRLMIGEPEGPAVKPGTTTVYFQVEDIQRSADLLRQKGIDFISTPHLVARLTDHELWMAFFKDPYGNPLALMSEVPLQ